MRTRPNILNTGSATLSCVYVLRNENDIEGP